MRVDIMRGITGSGKSTEAKKLVANGGVIVSADHFFMIGDKYHFDVSLLSAAHQSCFRNFMQAIMNGEKHIVVDNTNLSAIEIAPYVLAGEAYGYEVVITTLTIQPHAAALRGTHGVEERKVNQMYERLQEENARLGFWWKCFFIPATFSDDAEKNKVIAEYAGKEGKQ